jgi:hypothetical protein
VGQSRRFAPILTASFEAQVPTLLFLTSAAEGCCKQSLTSPATTGLDLTYRRHLRQMFCTTGAIGTSAGTEGGRPRRSPPPPLADAPSAEAVEVEAEGSAIRPYPTGGWGWEMSGDDHDRSIGKGLKETPPRRARSCRVDTKTAVERRFGAL